jgi:hypothetical protein
MKNLRFIVIALPFALLPLIGSAQDSDPVAILKASLKATTGFEVERIVPGDDGASCIIFRFSNDNNGTSRGHAVVDDGKALSSKGGLSGNRDFQKAWKEKCVNKD